MRQGGYAEVFTPTTTTTLFPPTTTTTTLPSTTTCADISDRGACNDDPNCEWVGSPKNGTCEDATVCVPDETPEATCTDGVDNDCDGNSDWDESDCSTLCANTGENDLFVVGQTDCNQWDFDRDHDGDQPGNWNPVGR